MIVGHPSRLAIESHILRAYAERHAIALGSVTVHVDGVRFGVPDEDATMMACSLDTVERLLAERGSHRWPLLSGRPAWDIARAWEASNDHEAEHPAGQFLGATHDDFWNQRMSARVVWAPDGDEAFDDSSTILILDEPNTTRIVAFRCGTDEAGRWAPLIAREYTGTPDDVYGVLRSWRERFLDEWGRTPKTPSGSA